MSQLHTQFELVTNFMRKHGVVIPSKVVCNFRRYPQEETYTHSFLPGMTSDGITDGAVSYVVLGGQVKYVSNDSLTLVKPPAKEKFHRGKNPFKKRVRITIQYDIDEI